SASYDRTVKLWDADTGRENRTLSLSGHNGVVTSVCFSPKSDRLASVGSGIIKVWNAETGAETLTIKGLPLGTIRICFHPDGTRLAASGSGDGGTVKMWDAQTGQEILTIKDAGLLQSLCFSPDGKHLAGGILLRGVKVWEAQTGQLERTL